MERDKLKSLLTGLHEELQQADAVDDELLALVTQLGDDIDRIEEASEHDDDDEGPMALAEVLQTRFAASHPTAEGLMREIIEALGRMGI